MNATDRTDSIPAIDPSVPHVAWPSSIDRVFRPMARVTPSPTDKLNPHMRAEYLQRHTAAKRQFLAPKATGLTLAYDETFFVNEADHTAHSNSASETSLLAGTNKQPIIPANWLLQQSGAFRGVSITARGVLSTTSTPTIVFQVRFGETAGATFLSGTSVAVSAAITTASGITNALWELRLDLICTVRGIGTNNATLSGAGLVSSPTGFASPFVYQLTPTTPPTATWTSTINAAVTQYLNLSATWSAASASNTITCKQLICKTHG